MSSSSRDGEDQRDPVAPELASAKQEVHEEKIGELFTTLASEMAAEAEGDEGASVRSSVVRASVTLGADAASIFLLSPDGGCLHGALVGWDWTRTSFVAKLEHWPNVQRAIADNEPCYVTSETAKLAEEVWFERRGIHAAICAPMAAHGRVLGVLFFDYAMPTSPGVDVAVAKGVADQCARLVERAEARANR